MNETCAKCGKTKEEHFEDHGGSHRVRFWCYAQGELDGRQFTPSSGMSEQQIGATHHCQTCGGEVYPIHECTCLSQPEGGEKIEYVLGFMFSAAKERLVLIRKSKPDWQRGKLNGIGGKIENESKYLAMVREFREETGLETKGQQWEYFCRMEGKAFVVHCFATVGDIHSCRTVEQETVEIVQVNDIDCRLNPLKNEMVENLPWLIHLAIDYLEDQRPGFTVAGYDEPFPFSQPDREAKARKVAEEFWREWCATHFDDKEAFLRLATQALLQFAKDCGGKV